MRREPRVRRRSILARTAIVVGVGVVGLVSACGIDLVGAATQDDDVVTRPDADRSDVRGDGDLEGATGDSGAGDCPDVCDECSGGTCRISCSGSTCEGATITCPEGMNCRVECAEKGACNKTTIVCADNRTCSILCAEEACTNADIQGARAQYLCVDCTDNGGAPACDALSCSSPGRDRCQRVCGRDSCRGMSGCGECRDFFFCP